MRADVLRRCFAAAVVASGACGSAGAAILNYQAILDGPSEAPPNASTGTGFATFTIDTTLHTMNMQVTFTGLVGTVTAAHIHGPTSVPGAGTAGVMTTTPTFAGFPSGVTSGAYNNTLDLTLASSWNPSFVTANGGTTAAAEAAFLAALASGKAYLNIHSTAVPGGEIRGFLQIPAPSALGLAGMSGLVIARRRRHG